MAKMESIFLEGTTEYAVLMCHPLAETPDMMKEFAKKLNKKGYTVSIPLLPGHGSSFEALINTDFNDWYHRLEEEYQSLEQSYKVFVCGMSIGGSMAIKLSEAYNPVGVASINAPIIGFDVVSDVYGLKLNTLDINEETLLQYEKHRSVYFDEVVKLGQIEQLKKITSPLFILQGSLDTNRYKTSSHMLMTYVSSKVKQRKDYGKSRHLILVEPDRKEAMKDIYHFFESQK